MKYTFSQMKNSMPAWKRKKDPVLTKVFYRPVSFALASICANHGISANTISYLSAIVAIVGSALFIPQDYMCHIIGALLFNVWIIMDCIDGNLARCVRKQPFGEFADSMSSYILMGTMGAPMGIAAYYDGGLLIPAGSMWLILLGAIASSSDSLMRLIYQKYKNIERKMADMGVVEVGYDLRNDTNQVGSFRVRVENELGIGGILPFAILVGTIFRALDIVVIFCALYYGASFVVSVLMFSRKAIIAAKENADKMPQ